jgi:hypothetical protein
MPTVAKAIAIAAVVRLAFRMLACRLRTVDEHAAAAGVSATALRAQARDNHERSH